MPLKTGRQPGNCPRARAYTTEHWHHTCWNCGADLCSAVTGTYAGPGCYTCRCGCAESDNLFVPHEVGYDPEVAAALPSPG